MQEVREVGRASLGTPRTPVSVSTDPSRRGSLRTALPARNVEPVRPPSPRTRSSRKRAASLDLEAASHPRLEDLTLDSAGPITPLTSNPLGGERVCLCQPDPKIPRPRNAFILYRQHHQAQVVAQHPGLANPEISKIIGEQWREQDPDIKDQWKRLAEEEKTRHQRQYPGYRYQPRRSAKGTTGLRPISTTTGDDPTHCPKCNGRYISTPGTPPTPFTPVFEARSQHSSTSSRTAEVARPRPPYSAPMQNTRVESSRGAPPYHSVLRRPPYGHVPSLPTHHEVDDDMEMMSPAESSDTKRRRYNQESYRYNSDSPRGYASSPGPYSAPQPFARNGPPLLSAVGHRQQLQHQQQQHLPPTPGMLSRAGNQQGSMGPPPQHISQLRHAYTPQSATFDESLRLPPLQTQLPASSSAKSARVEYRSESKESQARSVEAMVMTIPYINKIKVLAKISPPLAPPGPSSPAVETRGAVIAVEGTDKELLADVGAFIEDHLRKDPFFAVRTWNGPSSGASTAKEGSGSGSGGDVVMSDGPKDEGEPYAEYLKTITDWHAKSRQIITHITTSPTTQPTSSDTVTPPKTIPIALIPSGFSLATSDAFALKIPINDSYAPVDHWQWMATLWRGIVGPDLTVYVSRVGRDEMGAAGGVEIRKDCQGIVVRVEGKKGEAGMDEKTKRRLGFEVLEFVRNPEVKVSGRV